jgi:hypothetical protein
MTRVIQVEAAQGPAAVFVLRRVDHASAVVAAAGVGALPGRGEGVLVALLGRRTLQARRARRVSVLRDIVLLRALVLRLESVKKA